MVVLQERIGDRACNAIEWLFFILSLLVRRKVKLCSYELYALRIASKGPLPCSVLDSLDWVVQMHYKPP